MIVKAIRFATEAHKGQKRRYTNQDYILHPLRVFHKTTLYRYCTEDMAIAALLHDTVEDCNIGFGTISCVFGDKVAEIVKELTNTSKITHPNESRAVRKRIDRERLGRVSKSAKIIKMIDRIDNLNDIPIDEEDFLDLYLKESELLYTFIKDGDDNIAQELLNTINMLYNKRAEIQHDARSRTNKNR